MQACASITYAIFLSSLAGATLMYRGYLRPYNVANDGASLQYVCKALQAVIVDFIRGYKPAMLHNVIKPYNTSITPIIACWGLCSLVGAIHVHTIEQAHTTLQRGYKPAMLHR